MKQHILTVFVLLLIHPAIISAQDTFTISNSYQNLLSNREQTGMLDLLFIELFNRLDMEAEIVYSSTERSLPDVNAGVFDGEGNRIAGMEAQYPNLRRVPEPNMTMEFVAFAKHEHKIEGWDSIRDLDIGIVRGWRILEDNTKDGSVLSSGVTSPPPDAVPTLRSPLPPPSTTAVFGRVV